MQSSIVVLKFGSSVLRTAADLPRAVDEIYRYVRDGQSVIAVVSAYAGETDRLFTQVRASGGGADEYVVAALVATGEKTTAEQLCVALDEAGLPARMRTPGDFGLHAQGAPLDAELVGLDRSPLLAELREGTVCVIPGFVAIDSVGRTVLLGRGGTDLSAVFIAQRLGAECVLIKDVDGIYVRDPALPGPRPPRFHLVTWSEALRVGAELVQPKALQWAESRGFPLRVAALGSTRGTRINGAASSSLSNGHAPATRVTLLGLGTVGGGVYERLRLYPEHFSIERILVRNRERHIAAGVPNALLTDSIARALGAEADVVVDALGAGEPALSVALAALCGRRTLVSANKANLAGHWQRFGLDRRSPTPRVRVSASVGGGVPVLERIERLKSRSSIVAVRAVLNGTCNYVLERMQDGVAYAEALREAQLRGFAEADPRLDVSGQDAASKLTLLALAAFSEAPAVVECEGIERIDAAALDAARDSGGALKLVATLERREGALRARVEPVLVSAEDFLAGARLEENRFEILLREGEIVRMRGRGAGRWPTTTAVMGDLWSLRRELSGGL